MPIKFFLLVVCFHLSINALGQNKSQKIKVFIDCSETPCDYNFIKTEITLIDFVLDRLAADAHVLITSVRSGSGGTKIQYLFLGQHTFKSRSDTLISLLHPNITDVELRQEVTNKIKMGLIPFLAHSEYANQINLTLAAAEGSAVKRVDTPPKIFDAMTRVGLPKPTDANSPSTDKWNYWIFNIGSDGTANIDQNYASLNASGFVTANRTTNDLKVSVNLSGSQNNSSYSYENNGVTSKYVVNNSNLGLYHKLVRSISSHWSAGYETAFINSTFSNIKGQLYFRPAIEYAIFPYSQVNTKFLTISYGMDVRKNNYYQVTIYDKLSETLIGHKLQAYLSVKQKWGNINSNIVYSNFFNNWKFNNLSVNLSLNIRITGGLFFYVYSNAGLTRDQLYLVKGVASEQDVLIRRRQLASAYNFYSGIGLNFRFGSILNNFVNPRFDQP